MKKLIFIAILFIFCACGSTVNLNDYTKQTIERQGKTYVVTTRCDYKKYHYVNAVTTNKEKHLKEIRKQEYTKAKDAVQILMDSDVYTKKNKK